MSTSNEIKRDEEKKGREIEWEVVMVELQQIIYSITYKDTQSHFFENRISYIFTAVLKKKKKIIWQGSYK